VLCCVKRDEVFIFSVIMAAGSEVSRRPRGPCAWCVNAVKWVPVILIVTIIVWSYYAYVIQLCFCEYALRSIYSCELDVINGGPVVQMYRLI